MRHLARRQYSSITDLQLTSIETEVNALLKKSFDQIGSALILQIFARAVRECSVVEVACQYSLCVRAMRNLHRAFRGVTYLNCCCRIH